MQASNALFIIIILVGMIENKNDNIELIIKDSTEFSKVLMIFYIINKASNSFISVFILSSGTRSNKTNLVSISCVVMISINTTMCSNCFPVSVKRNSVRLLYPITVSNNSF